MGHTHSLEDELTLARSELSAAHAALDALGVPRYGKTDYPLPLAVRIHEALKPHGKVTFANGIGTLESRMYRGTVPLVRKLDGQMSVDDVIEDIERGS